MTRAKTVYQFDLKGNYLNSFNGTKEAGRVTNIAQGTIRNGIYKYNLVRGKFYFSYKKQIDILDMCLLNNPLKSQYTGRYKTNIMFRNKSHNIEKCTLGKKDESYFTESEMIIGYEAPSYKELSKDEKIIWKELEKFQ